MSVKRSITMALFAVFTIAAGVMPADASKPVRRTIAGCVFNGSFISGDGYTIQPRYADGREADLRPLEGHAVTISGALLPGDAFILKSRPRDQGACKIMRPAGR
jgi:hypothetical protein